MQGLTNRQIATRLHLSERTVARHLDNIRTGLDLHTRAEMAAWNARQLIPVAGLGATPGTAGRRLLSGGLTGQNLRWLSRHLRWLSRWSWQWPGLLPGAAQ